MIDPRRIPVCSSLLLAAVALVLAAPAVADEPSLHERIDQLLAAKAGGEMAPAASDAEFLRRVTLDLAGRIPTADELRAFLADQDKDKRTKAIDKLLASDEYARRMAEAFDVMLMERLGEHEEWTKFLRGAFAANKGWDQMVREIVRPNADDEATRGSAFFLSKRLENYGQNPVDHPALVRDVGRLFLGIDVQCAQCHDHLFVDEYKQDYYHGLAAFLAQASIRQDVKFPAIGEGLLTAKTEFQSVFVPGKKATGPKLPGGEEVAIPAFEKGEEFVAKPDRAKNFPGVPKFSPLSIMSEQLPKAENRLFSRNIANRVWWLVMGRGLVWPLDLSHKDNPATHPDVLDLISNELVAHKFDLKWLMRELLLTAAYQRASQSPEGWSEEPKAESYRTALEKPLTCDQLLAAILEATGTKKQILGDNVAAGLEKKEYKDLRVKFTKAFANPPREPEVEHHPSVKAALFVLNDATVLAWLKPKDDNLLARALKLPDDQVAEELYVNILSRMPVEEEKAEVKAFLEKHKDAREKALGHFAWALLAGTEFQVNH